MWNTEKQELTRTGLLKWLWNTEKQWLLCIWMILHSAKLQNKISQLVSQELKAIVHSNRVLLNKIPSSTANNMVQYHLNMKTFIVGFGTDVCLLQSKSFAESFFRSFLKYYLSAISSYLSSYLYYSSIYVIVRFSEVSLQYWSLLDWHNLQWRCGSCKLTFCLYFITFCDA